MTQIKMTKEDDYYWIYYHDHKRDIRVFEIRKSTVPRPWTIVIFDHSKATDLQLFSDIFQSAEWDPDRGSKGISRDIYFLLHLWQKLGLDKVHGEFLPKHVLEDNSRCPSVYRRDAEQVMLQKFQKVFSKGELFISYFFYFVEPLILIL